MWVSTLILIVFLVGWGMAHSLLASLTVKDWTRRVFGSSAARRYRLVYNITCSPWSRFCLSSRCCTCCRTMPFTLSRHRGRLSNDELWALESKEGNYAKVACRGSSAQEYL